MAPRLSFRHFSVGVKKCASGRSFSPLYKRSAACYYWYMSRFIFKPLYENPLFTFVALSDVHMRGNEKYRAKRLRKALLAIASNKQVDAIVLPGDVTDHGEEVQWQLLEELFAERHLPETVLCLGNHDMWTTTPSGKDDFFVSFALFRKYAPRITGKEYEKAYYRQDVRGYTFLCMASEGTDVGAYISPEQIDWLDKELNSLPADRPVFVVSHFALNKTHGLPRTFGDKKYTEMTGGFGAQSDAINAVLQKHSNVVLISGHSHMGLAKEKTYCTFEKVNNIHSVNLPCFMFPNHDGIFHWGVGMVVEVYADKTVFRFRNFVHNFWYKKYTFVI